MTWSKLGDDFADRRDLMRCSRSARLLHVEALVHCNRLLTDGHLLRAELRRITDAENPADLADELVLAGVWTLLDDGWLLSWEDQEPAELVRRRQDQNRERQGRKRRHDSGDHSGCNPRYCKAAQRDVTRDVTPGVTGGVTASVTTPRPDPTRPGPKETGRGRRCANNAILTSDGTCCAEHGQEAAS